MAAGLKAVFRELKKLFHLGVIASLSDAQLLEKLLGSAREAAKAAFAAVVERHGPMVLRVCRQILIEPHDAEDTFQVPFLVLARQAHAIARRERFANWLYGVAVRTAKDVRGMAIDAAVDLRMAQVEFRAKSKP
jgi:RNA polymerase sigma-70 factor (ECF subfamily)